MTSLDSKMMTQALELASKGRGWTKSNPMVGAVITKDGKIIGQGYYEKFGGPHAEVNAINSVDQDLKDATMYVTLEPHAHQGKTPSCVNAIINSRINKVVFSTFDPNPLVKGKGKKLLEQADIDVVVGAQSTAAMKLNEAYFTFHQKKRPFVVLKFAASLDGKIATSSGNSKWITNVESRKYAHGLRGQYQSILVGINTILADDPHLGARNKSYPDPTRIILDSKLQIPLVSKVLRDENVILATTNQASRTKIKKLEQRGMTVLVFQSSSIPLTKLLAKLTELNVISIFVEGGSNVAGSFVNDQLVDKVYAFYGPLLIGGNKSIPVIGGKGNSTIKESLFLEKLEIQRFSEDILITGYPRKDN